MTSRVGPSVPSPDSDSLEGAIRKAVRKAYKHDAALVGDQNHERAVMFQVGRYLAADVDGWPGPWHVDLEYNRMHDDALEVVSKRLSDTPWYRDGSVIPDLIVHDRRESSARANLLVLEAKLRPSSAERMSDCAKLAAYLEELDYQYAVFLEFPLYPAPPRWAWFTSPDDVARMVDNAAVPVPLW